MAASATTALVIDRNVSCTMRDGTVLRCDVYRPAQAGPLPVLLNRTPYSKVHGLHVTGLVFHPFIAIARGYVVVVQDSRGRYESDGEWTPLHGEAQDGYDTVEWVAQQPWCNGDVGIYGASYMGVTSLQAAAAHPPHLRAAVAYLTGANHYDGWVYSGGAFELALNLRWCAKQAVETLRRSDLKAEAREKVRKHLLWINDHPEEAVNFTPLEDVFGPAEVIVPYWRNWLRHSSYDDYWRSVDATRSVPSANIAVLNIAGMYDGLLKGHMDLHRSIVEYRRQHGKGAREDLILGPWDHEAYQSIRPTFSGEASFGSAAMSGTAGLGVKVLDWFDKNLKADSARPEGGGSVSYFMMGPNEWRTSPTWPPSSTEKVLYLAGERANSSSGNGALLDKPAQGHTASSYIHDPTNPVPTTGGRHLGYWLGHSGVVDQSQVEKRIDILVFTTGYLMEDIALAGLIRVEVYVRSAAKSADFTAKLVNVRADGYCVNIAEGVRRAEPPSDTSKPWLVEIDLWDSAYIFKAGTRIRLEIASSNFPRFDVNGGLAESSTATHKADWQTSVQEIHSGSDFPSRIIMNLEK